MPDEIDVSAEQYSDWLANRVENTRRAAAERPLTPNGLCHNCDDPVKEGLLFCDADCTRDYDYRITLERKRRVENA